MSISLMDRPANRINRGARMRLGLEAVFPLAAFVYGVLLWPTLHEALLERHPFRQTQTAFMARTFAARGIDLLHPVVPVFGVGSRVAYEMPWYEAIASLPIRAGISEEFSLRAVTLVFTLITARLLVSLVTSVLDQPSGVVAGVLYLFSPFTMLWGRTSMIETFTTAMVIGWVYLLVSERTWSAQRRIPWLAVATCLGILGWTSKITTAIPWSLMLIPGTVQLLRERKWRRLIQLVLAAAVPALAGIAWTAHADSVKAASPFTAWLTSDQLFTFNFGTINQRLDWRNWATIGSRLQELILGRYGTQLLVVVGVYWLWRTRGIVVALSVLAVPAAAISIFFNLYVAHDYYLAAIAPAVSALQAIGLVACCRIVRARSSAPSGPEDNAVEAEKRVPWLAGVTAVLLIVVISGATRYWTLPFQFVGRLPVGTADLTEWTTDNEPIVVNGMDWDPQLFFYAHRQGVMLAVPHVTAEMLRKSDQFKSMRALFSVRYDKEAEAILRGAQWIAPVTKYLYRFAPQTSAADLVNEIKRSPLPVVFRPTGNNDPTAIGATTVRIKCAGNSVDVSGLGRSLVIRATGAKSFAFVGLAALPAEGGGLILTSAAPSQLTCSGPVGSFIEISRASP